MSNPLLCCGKGHLALHDSEKETLKTIKKTEKKSANKMEHVVNGNHIPAVCPFSGNSAENVNDKRNLRVKLNQPMKLRNYLDNSLQTLDTLHTRENDIALIESRCTRVVCSGSVIDIPRPDAVRTPDEIYCDAEKFFKEYYASIRRENSDAHMTRLQEVKAQLETKGTYNLKSPELVYATKLAWRNATRCIGRIQWKKLQVFDCREVTTAKGMFEALCTHIKYATNKGNIRSAITIFPQRTDGMHDYRIWNPQLINYAGYVQEDGSVLGDPGRVEFTNICIKLGWKPPYTMWDILPLVLQADGKEPEFFDLPRDIVLEVQMEHPELDWFKELGLRWYALPAVANMRLDCGGIEFTATAFNGWYMGTEIGCRNFCDASRLNILEKVALKMGLETTSAVSLWKDQAVVEINKAVLHSFHRDIVSIVDHHSASEQFMKHLENENKARGGCPADWVWIVPPLSSSLTQVFHQEMANYYMKPSYEYQTDPWKKYNWEKSGEKPHRKFHFKQIARAVKFTSKLFTTALSRRVKVTILYATETGKSEQYAKELGTIFGHAFNAQVFAMDEYDMFSIEHETLILIVTSTFGNGEPPANGQDFIDHLFQMQNMENELDGSQSAPSPGFRTPTPKSLMRTNSVMSPPPTCKRPLSRVESNRSTTGDSSLEHLGPLSNVSFAVFGLGSSAYPKFANFAKTVDRVLGELGGERILEIATGDEMFAQEQEFRAWSSKIFQVAAETFCVEETMLMDAKNAISKLPLTEETVRFGKPSTTVSMKQALESTYKRQVIPSMVKKIKRLGDHTEDRETIFVDMQPRDEVKYDPGDHLGVMPCNREEIVNSVLKRLKETDFDVPVQLQMMKETLSPLGSSKTWEKHERIPAVSIRDLFTRFLDITTPPPTTVLKYLAKACSDEKDTLKINELILDSEKYDEWKHFNVPHLGEVLEELPSCKPQGSLLAALLPTLQPRFYSISSSPLAHPKHIHLTVAIVFYKVRNGEGPVHYGVCSNYLKNLKENKDEIFVFIRRAPNFHLPKSLSVPLILIGPGSGIAPLRGFWHHRKYQIKELSKKEKIGQVWLFFGCRTKGMDIYRVEKEQAVREGTLNRVFLALSREAKKDKKYVQDHLREEGQAITRMLMEEGGHFYVCGDCKMAEEVQQTLKQILQQHTNFSELEAEHFIMSLMDDNRYHEDIFGIVLRTAEVKNASRETARRTRLESGQSQC
ncbi:nitric oxide synthase-like [Cydia pomonella]|uniref:nitric oxide synthase-like n=1 Tax=Cydia pomonella TaxID=82600 RepID=UPI002ADE3B7F|nr:nitric oxide synthase-like [Cydia pomonella]